MIASVYGNGIFRKLLYRSLSARLLRCPASWFNLARFLGEVSERLKEHAWKVCVRQKRTEGSNPSLSAKLFCLLRLITPSDSNGCPGYSRWQLLHECYGGPCRSPRDDKL